MNALYVLYARCYQKAMWVAEHFLDFSEPKVVQGSDSLVAIPDILIKNKKKGCLIVTDNTIYSLGLTKPLEKALNEKNVPYAIYHEVVPNPTIQNVQDGLKIYKAKGLDAVVAIGGGSSMDCAKMIATCSTNPKKPISKMKGVLHVTHKPDMIIAVPTTAGTGSETTVAAVILDPVTHDKYAVNDPKLIPDYAILEPKLLIGLPGKVTSTVGVDALCHALEAYIGGENTKKTKKYGLEAIKGIHDYLYKAYVNPENLEYRTQTQIAAYKAGVAFTRAYVGYVHSMAHAMGAIYNAPHGLAISIVLPYVLEAYGKKAYKKLAQVCDYCEIADPSLSTEEKAKAVIEWIKDLEKKMQIPNTIKGIADPKDFPVMADHAVKEANPLYPVPKIFTKAEIIKIYEKMYI